MISSPAARKYGILLVSIVILMVGLIVPQRFIGERWRPTKRDSSATNLRNI
jgi:hypothetical protein